MIPVGHQLRHLALAYFHQDFDLEASTPLGVVSLFVSGESSAVVQELASEIRSVLASSLTDTEIREIWINKYGASYDPMADGIEYRRWFAEILEILNPSLCQLILQP
jgi:hypothetical protein